jgi:hypothetical protein
MNCRLANGLANTRESRSFAVDSGDCATVAPGFQPLPSESADAIVGGNGPPLLQPHNGNTKGEPMVLHPG